jgi:tetratricopeptide (TPR) repeat protein
MRIFLKNHYLYLFCLIAAVFAVYGYSISFDFVWDDTVFTSTNPVYSGFNLVQIFTTPANGVEYLPIRDLTYVLDFLLWGNNPWGFHLSNLIYFSLNVICIYLFSNILLAWMNRSLILTVDGTAVKNTSFLAALLFALLPLNCEAACFITCRNVHISGIFFYVSCITFLTMTEQKNRTQFILLYCVSLVSFVLALFSKATVIMLPGILLLMVMYIRENRTRFILLIIPFIIISLASVYVFYSIARESNFISSANVVVFGSDSFLSRISIAVQIPFFYLKKIILPFGFSPEYITPFAGRITEWPVLSSIAFILLFSAVLFLYRKKQPLVIFSSGWFLIALIPVMNFFATNPVVADRYFYIPSFGVLLLLSYWILSLKIPGNNPVYKTLLSSTIIICFAFISFTRSKVWKNGETLWTRTIRDYPETKKAYNNLAWYYFDEKKYKEGLNFIETVRNNTIDSSLNNFFKGRYFYETSQYAISSSYFERIPKKDNYYKTMIPLLSDAYLKSGRISKAIKLNNELAYEIQDIDKKIKEKAMQRLVELQPWVSSFVDSLTAVAKQNPNDLNAISQVAIALDENCFYNEALDYYKYLEKTGGENWILFFNMGNVYKKTDRPDDALTYYQKSLAINKNFPDIYNNMAVVLKGQKKYDKGIDVLKSSLLVDPNHKESMYTLAQIYFLKGDKENALRYFTLLYNNHPEIHNDIKPYLDALK